VVFWIQQTEVNTYVPGEHSTQVTRSALENLPPAQTAHVVCPTPSEKRPLAQRSHARAYGTLVALATFPGGHATQAEPLMYSPARQLSVGTMDGAVVGSAVGGSDGCGLGSELGSGVGRGVGTGEGGGVGVKVGMMDTVGCIVGGLLIRPDTCKPFHAAKPQTGVSA
jgi:hypothetical protein